MTKVVYEVIQPKISLSQSLLRFGHSQNCLKKTIVTWAPHGAEVVKPATNMVTSFGHRRSFLKKLVKFNYNYI